MLIMANKQAHINLSILIYGISISSLFTYFTYYYSDYYYY
jgi:hypothetical protein